MNFQKYFKDIYEQVFCKTYTESYYVFLCGGTGKNCIRNSVKSILETNGYQILYPEDLFIDIISRDKKLDLLDYENLLAKNADVVCVICESPGSFAELGAFVQNDDIKSRTVVVIKHRYKRDNSFIMLGPVRHLKKINAEGIVEYRENKLIDLCNELGKSFNHIKKKWPRVNDKLSFSNLSTYISLLPMIIYFFQEIRREALYKELKKFLESNNLLPSDYSDLFNAAIKYLIKTRTIVSEIQGHTMQEQFQLTDMGINETKNILSKSKVPFSNRLHDSIRCGIMKEQLYN